MRSETMKNNLTLFIVLSLFGISQANSFEHKILKDLNIPKPYLFNGKTLKELNIALEIIEVVEWGKNIEVLGEIMDTNQYCAHIGSATKNKAQLKEYFLQSVFINSDYKGYYGIWQCDYNGKVKLFDKIWDFSSVSGSTTLSRKIPINQANRQSNEFYTYCDKGSCYEVINLVCENESCNPRATIME